MGPLLFLVFILLPLIELFLLVMVAGWIGWLNALGVLILLSVSGFVVLRRTGFAVNRSMRSGFLRGEDMTDAFWSMLAGWLLVVPGFGTAVIGLLLLLPPVRAFLALQAIKRARTTTMHTSTSTTSGFDSASTRSSSARSSSASSTTTIIEGDAVEIDSDDAPKKPDDRS